MTNRSFLIVLAVAATSLLPKEVRAGSATWEVNPATNVWTSETNWTPNTIPNSPTDIATFDFSNTTNVSISRDSIEVDSIVFDAAASAYSLSLDNCASLTFSGAGIINNSGVMQNLVVTGELTCQDILIFQNSASILGDVTVTVDRENSTSVTFADRARALETTFINNGTIFFEDNSSAGHSTFIINPQPAPGINPPSVYFSNPSMTGADDATFINNGATKSGLRGGGTFIFGMGNFGRSRMINYGGTARGASGGYTVCSNRVNVENVSFIGYGGTNGGEGGDIQLGGTRATNASVQIYGNSILDVTNGGGTIGSLEGEGTVILGSSILTIAGTRNMTFSGTIQNDGGVFTGDGGGLTKSGSGRLILMRGSTYDGDTAVMSGELSVNNKIGSGTGTGAVKINAGVLSGAGIISGAVTIGTGSGAGAHLTPRKAAHGKLTILSALSFNADATCDCDVNSDSGTATSVVANGVTIAAGAQFSLSDVGTAVLAQGTIFTVISNTGGAPIAGAFDNLPDGSTVTVGLNTFQADYEGGDGNDLTLTVVP